MTNPTPDSIRALIEEADRMIDACDVVDAWNLIAEMKDALEAAGRENACLRVWKSEALAVLSEWEEVWVAAGRPGKLGTSKAKSVRDALEAQATVPGDVIERAARALFDFDWHGEKSWLDVDRGVRVQYERGFRAALSAALTPKDAE